MEVRIEESCLCVQAARALGPVLPIPDKLEYDGQSTSDGSGPAIGYLIIRCGYCKTVLKSIEGFVFQ